MSQDLLLYTMTAFVVIAAIALCIQAGLLYAIYRSTNSVQQQVNALMPQVKNILAMAETTLQQSRQHVVEITAKANDIMDQAKVQMNRLDALMADASARARNQLERAEMVVDDTVSRVHESVAALHSGIMKPIREINGVAAGVRTALRFLLRGSRPTVDQATQDDEMFI